MNFQLNKKLISGFTLLELMITILVLAILVGIAIPSFQVTIQNSRLDNSVQSIYSVFNAARQEAISSGQKGFVCRSLDNPIISTNSRCRNVTDTDWNFGLVSYRSLSTIVVPAPNNSFGNQRINSIASGGANISTRLQMTTSSFNFVDNNIDYVSNLDNRVVVFNANGSLQNAAPFRLAVCDSRGESDGKYIEINSIGRVFLRSTTEAGTATDCSPV